ncbi:HAMP domain-containing sensor histidine kinase [Staphylococcus caprae]|uniref:sensor histidine kinase n=3 Tax=Staphylococcus TaxID=1279 RepID=UPI0008A92975|nr:HAMP domain-containing sensor histidine kinase [Staphylococcus sp. HMSC62A08]OHS39876.1 hypothetical protein HMPREF3264_03560 [Staphylococcus sp. HMSC62A08]
MAINIIFLLSILVILINFNLIIYIIKLKKELKVLFMKLNDMRSKEKYKSLNLTLLDNDLERLVAEINEIIEEQENIKVSSRRQENKLKVNIANISHDLRTPLSAILGYIFLIKNNKNIDIFNSLYIIEEKAILLNQLVQEFYELSVLKDPNYEVKNKCFDVVKVLADTIVGFYSNIEENSISPIIDIPQKQIFINSDEFICKRIFQNLIGNAVKYADNNIEINLKRLGNKIIFTIVNDTSNIHRKDIEDLYNRFCTISNTNRHSGLGLSIVQELIHKIKAKCTEFTLQEKNFKVTIEIDVN